MNTFRVLLQAESIPDGATVSKRTGEKLYTLRDRLRIFGEGGEPREIKALNGSRFIVGDTGDANCVNSNTELLWHVEASNLLLYIAGEEN